MTPIRPRLPASLFIATVLALFSGHVQRLEAETAPLKPDIAKRDADAANPGAAHPAIQPQNAGPEGERGEIPPSLNFAISGEIFIVSKDGSRFIPEGVTVGLYPRNQIEAWQEEAMQRALGKIEILQPQAARAAQERNEAYDKLQADLDAHAKVLDLARAHALARVMAETVQKSRDGLKKSQADFDAKTANWDALKGQISYLLSGQYYFDNLDVKPQALARTDSAGRFKLEAARMQNWVLLATARQNIGPREQPYYWVVPVAQPKGPVTEISLTNSNLTSAKNGQSMLKTRDED